MNTILVLVGSIRQESINRHFAKALEKLATQRLRFVYADIGALPHYNDDLWASPPDSVIALKRQLKEADGLLFVMPEYFRAPPGILLNALAWGGRPFGSNAWAGKPAAIVGSSPGVIGTAAAQSHLRAILPGLEVSLMGKPEVYFQMKPGLIDEHFEVSDEDTRAFLTNWVECFDAFVDRIAAIRTDAVTA